MTELKSLTEEAAIGAIREFFRGKPFLFFGTGMSCALDSGFGMSALKDVLALQMQKVALTAEQSTEWSSVDAALGNGIDLESALGHVEDQGLLRVVTEVTGSYLAELDQRFAFLLGSGASQWPASGILRRLVETLPEGDRALHALTPNYDMLFEYACDAADIPYANGQFGGVERKLDWKAVDRALLEPEQVLQGRRLRTVFKHRKHVRLYKVHGSLNYFFHHNAVIENDAWMWHPPGFAERVMITPGISKYQTLQKYRQELLRSADSAISRATHFLFLGYGFNDSHLEEYITRKLVGQASHGLIVTRDSNPRIEALLGKSENLWLVCKIDGPGTSGSRIFNKQYSDWLLLPGRDLWEIGNFTAQILGG